MTAKTPMVLLEAVDVDIEGLPVLREVDLELRAGRHLGIVGANGSGKSTLLALIGGRRWPAPGRGRRVYDFGGGAERDAVTARRRIAVVGHELQDLYYRRAWNYRALDVVLSGITRSDIPRRNPSPAARAKALTLLETMALAGLADRRLLELSRGEQRRVLIARALAFEPALLMLDEPASGLDAQARAGLETTLARAAESATLVTAAHGEDELPAVTREVLRLDGGRVVSRRAIRPRTAGTVAATVGADAGPAVIGGPTAAASRAAAPSAAQHDARRDAREDALIELENASVWLGDRRIIENLSWRLVAGQNWLVTGPNGAGKSTFLRLLHGELRPALGGEIRWPGLGAPKDIWTLRQRIALVSAELQARYRYPSTVLATIASGFRSTIGLTAPLSAAERDRARALAAAFELDAFADRPLASLSYGQRHRALIARTLAAEPRVVLLDEPWEGLDGATAQLVSAELNRHLEHGLTIVCVSHVGPGALPLDRELRLEDGRGRVLTESASLEPAREAQVRDNGDANAGPRGSSTSARRRAASSRPR